MKIINIDNNRNVYYNYNSQTNKKSNTFNLKMSEPIKVDTISFSAKSQLTSAEKLKNYAIKLLDEHYFKEGQKIHITGDAKYLPLINAISAEAYKKGSGLISYKIIEPELETLKKKYKITQEFDFIQKQIDDLKSSNALFINLDNSVDYYKNANLTKQEVKEEISKIVTFIPKNIRKLFKIYPEEILKNALDMHEGQPLAILCEREHLPFVEKLVEWAYSKNKTKLVNVSISNDNELNMLKYAKDEVLDEIPTIGRDIAKEYYEKDVAYLILDGADPKKYEGIPFERIIRNDKARDPELDKLNELLSKDVPWLVYNLPTTKSCANAYSEFKNPIEALKHAYFDANKLNRIGHLSEHVKELELRAKKMNELINKGYRTFHYVSIDPETKLPDGKTDLKVTMSPKSIFKGPRMEMAKYGHKPIVNIPSEEVCTAPQANTAQGVVSATMPLSLEGNIIEGIQFKFNKGKIVDIKATKNEEMLKNYIKSNKNADKLGEVAIVTNSPIAQTGRLFYSTLLDENASCHLAIGTAYPDTVKGAIEIEDYDKMQKYLKKLHINISDTHDDFMVGGKYVNISAINDETGEAIPIIQNDTFLL